MKVQKIAYSSRFLKQWDGLPSDLQRRARGCIEQFRQNPSYPSLRLHRLKGPLKDSWSISINLKYRIIFEVRSDTALFQSIGSHAIYEKR